MRSGLTLIDRYRCCLAGAAGEEARMSLNRVQALKSGQKPFRSTRPKFAADQPSPRCFCRAKEAKKRDSMMILLASKREDNSDERRAKGKSTTETTTELENKNRTK